MIPPFVNYVTFNRLGLTARNLQSVLDTHEDFEMHIIDSNSRDNTWEYLQDLKDPRIKSITRFELNNGPILPANYNLLKREPDQYFFTIDSDVYIKTKDWISQFMKVFTTFPEVGVLGVPRGKPYPDYIPPVLPRIKDGIGYLQLMNGHVGTQLDFVPGCFQCLRPELISEIGYWNEECGYGDAELSPRVNHYTSFKAGFMMGIEIDMAQSIQCNQCTARNWCRLNISETTCFTIRDKFHMNVKAANAFKQKYLNIFQELKEGKRTAYSASILDPEAMNNHVFHREWAMENFKYFIENSN